MNDPLSAGPDGDPFADARTRYTPGAADDAIIELHIGGHSVRAIADRLNFPVEVVRSAINTATAEGMADTRSSRIMVESARLDAVLRAFLPAATQGDSEAAGVVLAVGRDRRKLLGLDAPTAVTVDASVSITGIDDTVRRILDSALPVEVVDAEDFPVPDVSPALRLRTATPAAED